MSRSTLEWYEQMARGLVWAAGVVLVLSIVGAIIIASSDNALPLFEDVERQGRGVAALASLGGGLTSAGILAGLGAILRILVVERLERLGPAPATREEKGGRGAEGDPDEEPKPKRERR